MKLLIINGPNLNLLGKREKSIYGENSFEDYYKSLQNEFSDVDFEYYQSNVEGELINKLHEVGFSYDAIVMNAGAYTHTSLGIGDAIGKKLYRCYCWNGFKFLPISSFTFPFFIKIN